MYAPNWKPYIGKGMKNINGQIESDPEKNTLLFHSGPGNLKKVQAKKIVTSNK